MSKWVVDIHGDIEGDYEIIKEYEEPKWIPVTERLPEDEGYYLATIQHTKSGSRYIMTCKYTPRYAPMENPWTPDDPLASDKVVAWMPLPEVYKKNEVK